MNALARSVDWAVRQSDSLTVLSYLRVQDALKPVQARITTYLWSLQSRQEEQERSAEGWRQWEAEQRARQHRRAIEEQREQERERETAARARQTRTAALQAKGWPAEVIALVLNRQVRIGMTAEQVREAWGPPTSINTTTTRRGTHEQWVYGIGQYLYFEDEVLTSIQQTRTP